MLKQNENNLFRDRQETVRCLWFLWCDDLVCYWLHHNKHSRHILGVHANMITAVIFTWTINAMSRRNSHELK